MKYNYAHYNAGMKRLALSETSEFDYETDLYIDVRFSFIAKNLARFVYKIPEKNFRGDLQ